jgi:hypothetical protein
MDQDIWDYFSKHARTTAYLPITFAIVVDIEPGHSGPAPFSRAHAFGKTLNY